MGKPLLTAADANVCSLGTPMSLVGVSCAPLALLTVTEKYSNESHLEGLFLCLFHDIAYQIL